MGILKKTLAVVAVFCIAIAAVHVGTPAFVEFMVSRDCPPTDPNEACLTRMRAAGHVWSRSGDLTRAQYWYGRAAELGSAAAMFHLAWVHEELALGNGEDTAPAGAGSDLELAMAWYQRSADRGFAPSMNNLGQMYQNGRLGHQDHDAAFGWHLAAARAGNPVGRLNVAISILTGQGAAVDPFEAAQWITWMPNPERAADILEPTLGRTRLLGSSLPEAERELLRAAAKAGSPVQLMMGVQPLASVPAFPTFQETEDMQPTWRP